MAMRGSGKENYNCLVILGPTASGKTRFAVECAKELNGEIISADSRQVYKGLDIGTGKDLEEYGDVPYHLIDIRSPKDEYNLFNFQQDLYSVFSKIRKRKKFPIIVGGTPLYIDAILNEYMLLPVPINIELRRELEVLSLQDLAEILSRLKNVHNRSDLENSTRLIRAIEIAKYTKEHPELIASLKKARPRIKARVVGMEVEKKDLEKRIYARLIKRLDEGMIEEVSDLHKEGLEWEYLESLGLEYRETSLYLKGVIATKDEYIKLLFRKICKFAKRQRTWFRKMEREGINIEWISS